MDVWSGIIPVFAVIAAGFAIRRTGLVPEPAWAGVNKLAYSVLFPSLLVSLIVGADFSAGMAGAFVAAGLIGFAAMGALAFLALPMARTDAPAFTSVFQGAMRWNGFIVLALIGPAFGPDSLALVALLFGPAVPMINVASVIVLSVWGDNGGVRLSAGDIARRIATNPFVIACLIGLSINFSGLDLPKLAGDALDLVGRTALGIALLAVGAGLRLDTLKAKPMPLGVAIVFKLVVAPVAFGLAGLALGLEGAALAALVAVGASPGASASYVLAKEMGGDAELSAAHITATTLLAAIALPVWIAVFLAA